MIIFWILTLFVGSSAFAGLLDSVGLRAPTESDPYPEDLPSVPDRHEFTSAIAGSA